VQVCGGFGYWVYNRVDSLLIFLDQIFGKKNRSVLYYNLGGYLLVQRYYEDARDCFRRALEIDPDYEIVRERLSDMESVLLLQHIESAPIHLLPASREMP
jgi:tetratricopeptide (TPR) repeat protein